LLDGERRVFNDPSIPTLVELINLPENGYIYAMNNPTQKHWYAAYTHSRAEKKVARELQKQEIEHYLPLVKTIRQWSDRKKKVEEPLIRSYIFVHITDKEYMDVLQTAGVMTIVRFSGKPVAIPDWQIENLKILLGASIPIDVENHDFAEGEEVRITRGTLEGLRGTIQQVKGGHKLVISIHALHYHMTVDIDPAFVKAVNGEW
jgi:transcriptional antiterminator RfaH